MRWPGILFYTRGVRRRIADAWGVFIHGERWPEMSAFMQMRPSAFTEDEVREAAGYDPLGPEKGGDRHEQAS